MGFLSKIWKKTVGKVWKGIKKVAMKVGKFMNKLGIVGQIGLSLLLPGLGNLLGGWAATMMASSSGIISGAGKFLNAAINIGSKIGSVVKSVSEGVKNVVGEVFGAVANKIPGMDKLVSKLSNGKFDISNKNWASIKKVTEGALADSGSAISSLFSKGTLTDLNPYAVKVQLEETLAENPISTPDLEISPETEKLELPGKDATVTTPGLLDTPKGEEVVIPPIVTGELVVPPPPPPPVAAASKLSVSNIATAIIDTYGAKEEEASDGYGGTGIDVPDLDQDRGAVLAGVTERRVQGLQIQGLYNDPNSYTPTSSWSQDMAQNLSYIS